MTAATERRIISRHGGALPAMMGHPGLKADEVVKQGWLIMLEAASGYLVEATAATGLLSAGLAMQDADATDKSSGDCRLDLVQGVVDLVGKTGGGDDLALTDIGRVVYAVDNQTVGKVATSRSPAGFLVGINEENSMMRVWVGFAAAALAKNLIAGTSVQTGTGALSSGVLTVATGITVTSSSKVYATRNTKAGTIGVELEVKDADLVVGGSGVGTIIVRSLKSDGTAETSDTSTVNYLIVG